MAVTRTLNFLMLPLPSAAIAMLVYGAWAFCANYVVDITMALTAAAIQGSYAFVMTFFLAKSAVYCYGLFGEGVAALFISFTLCFLVLLTVPTVLHLIAGTPNILLTILPGLLWGSGYILLLLMSKQRMKQS